MNNSDNPEYNLQIWSVFLAKVVFSDESWWNILLASILIIIFIVGLIGNLLTCVVIYSDKTMHTATNFYLFNMAVSDTVVSFGIFLEIYVFLNDMYIFSNVTCKLHFFFVIVLWNNSILVMTALAIERYIAIWHPLLLKSAPAWKRVMKVICFIWIIAICETAPEILTVELIKTPSITVCYTVPSPLARIINGILALVTFIIPLGIMLFVYTMIALKVSVSEKSNSEKKIFNHKDNRRKVNKLVGKYILISIKHVTLFFYFISAEIDN